MFDQQSIWFANGERGVTGLMPVRACSTLMKKYSMDLDSTSNQQQNLFKEFLKLFTCGSDGCLRAPSDPQDES